MTVAFPNSSLKLAKPLKVLVGCETSGVVRRAFAELGHDVWSCDLLPADDGSNRHIICDIRDILHEGWDLLAVSRLREGDFAANAAMLCADPLFHQFLERRQNPAQTRAVHNKEHADTVLKSLIGITSKTQLNREERAQAAFIDLRTDFELWKGGRS